MFSDWQTQLRHWLEQPFNQSDVSVSYYDMGWLYRLSPSHDPEGILFPQLLPKLLNAQQADGTWTHQAQYNYVCDTLLTTFSVMIALHQRCQVDDRIPHAVRRASQAINNLLPEVDDEPYISVGFEMLLPALLQEALDHGFEIRIPPAVDTLMARREQKLRIFPLNSITEEPTTVLHSLEGFYQVQLNWQKLLNVQDTNGAFLSSPAATAKVYQATQDEHALKYLQALVEEEIEISVNTPLDIFEINWSLKIIHQLHLETYVPEFVAQGMQALATHWTNQGLSWSSQFTLPDLDNTSVAYDLLTRHGYQISAQVFENFYEGDSIYCFPGEIDSSPTHLLHFVQALTNIPALQQIRQSALNTLHTLFEHKDWRDKWHISPYYTIALAIHPLSEETPDVVNKMLLDIFSANIHDLSLEEIGWICLALYQVRDIPQIATQHETDIATTLNAGLSRVRSAYNPNIELDNLWIDKCLYSPHSIVHTLITAVLLRDTLDMVK